MSHAERCDCKDGDCECGEGCSCGCDCNCNCDCGGHFRRRFQTKAEQIEALAAYLGELKLEVQAVEERLVDLKK